MKGYDAIAWGRKVEAPQTSSTIDDGLRTTPERIALAERHWPRARPEDFERIDRRGKRWRDRATGTTFRVVAGCGPLLKPTVQAVDLWFEHAGRIVLLVNDSRVEGMTTTRHGPVVSGEIDPRTGQLKS